MTTIVLAIVGRMSSCGEARSATVPIQRVAGHAASATSAATAKRSSPAPAQLIARRRASDAPLRRFSDRSVRCLQRLAPERVSGLDGERVQRPEVCFRQAEQWAPTDPGDRQEGDEGDRGADPRRLGEPVRGLADPAAEHERREAEQDGGQEHRRRPGEDKLRQADLGNEAAGDGEKRALLRGGAVVLHVAEARIEKRLRAFWPTAAALCLDCGKVHGARAGSWNGPEA